MKKFYDIPKLFITGKCYIDKTTIKININTKNKKNHENKQRNLNKR